MLGDRIMGNFLSIFKRKDDYSNYLKKRNMILKEYNLKLKPLVEFPKKTDKFLIELSSFEDLLEASGQKDIYYKMEDESCLFFVSLDNEMVIYVLKKDDKVICEFEEKLSKLCSGALKNDAESLVDGSVEDLEDTMMFRFDEDGFHLEDSSNVSESVNYILGREEELSKTMYLKKIEDKYTDDEVNSSISLGNVFDIRLKGYAVINGKKKILEECNLFELLSYYFNIKLFLDDTVKHNITIDILKRVIMFNLKIDSSFLKRTLDENANLDKDDLLFIDFDTFNALYKMVLGSPWSKYGKKFLTIPGDIIDSFNKDLVTRKNVYAKLLSVPEQVNFFRFGAKDENDKEITWYSILSFEKIVLKNSDTDLTISDTSYYLGRVGTKVQRVLWLLSKYLFFELKDKRSLQMFLNENLIDKFYMPFHSNKNIFNFLYDYLKYVYFYAETMSYLKVLLDSKGNLKKWSTSPLDIQKGFLDIDKFSEDILKVMRGKLVNSYLVLKNDDEFLNYRKYLRKGLADIYIIYLRKIKTKKFEGDFYEFVFSNYPEYEELLKK